MQQHNRAGQPEVRKHGGQGCREPLLERWIVFFRQTDLGACGRCWSGWFLPSWQPGDDRRVLLPAEKVLFEADV